MHVPTRNSDVDNYLDAIFDPVLQQHDMNNNNHMDVQRLAYSIKGGGNEPATTATAQMPTRVCLLHSDWVEQWFDV